MTGHVQTEGATPASWVAIDIAQDARTVLAESPRGRRAFRVADRLEDVEAFSQLLSELSQPVRIGFEATGIYHRPLA